MKSTFYGIIGALSFSTGLLYLFLTMIRFENRDSNVLIPVFLTGTLFYFSVIMLVYFYRETIKEEK